MSKTINTRVESYEIQPNNIIRPSALFKMFQKAACDDLDSFGITYEDLKNAGIAFVITKMTVKFYEDIKKYDELCITTRPRCVKGVFFIRDFDVFANGVRVAYASSFWVLLDINTRKALRPSAIDAVGTIPTDASEPVILDEVRVKLDENFLARTDVRRVYYSQIDANRHMNNTFYPDIVYDYMPKELRHSLKDKIMTINYSSEVLENESFDIYTKTENGRYMILAKNTDNKKNIFSGIIDF